MIIKKLKFRNIKSYGNKIQEITFDNKGGLTLLTGTNGSGKCLSPDTEIDISIDDKEIELLLIEFLKNKSIGTD